MLLATVLKHEVNLHMNRLQIFQHINSNIRAKKSTPLIKQATYCRSCFTKGICSNNNNNNNNNNNKKKKKKKKTKKKKKKTKKSHRKLKERQCSVQLHQCTGGEGQASSTFQATSFQNEHFVRGLLNFSSDKLPKRAFRAKPLQLFKQQAFKTSISCEAPATFQATSFQNEDFVRGLRNF